MHSTSHSFPIEQFQHLPNPYPHDAIRDSFIRTNIVNLDLASPTPPRLNPRSHPLTPPDTPSHHSSSTISATNYDQRDQTDTVASLFVSAGLHLEVTNCPTRYLVVSGVPPDAQAPSLSSVFSGMGDLKGMFVRYQKNGVVILSWHDIRHAKKAHSALLSNLFFSLREPLSVAFIAPFNLIKATGESPFVNGREGNLTIIAEQAGEFNGHQPVNLHAAFALFGELSSFVMQQGVGVTTYYASYYDARDAANAAKAIHGRSILGMLIRVTEGFPEDEKAWQESLRALDSSVAIDKPPEGLTMISRSQPSKKMQYSYSSACRRPSNHELRRAPSKAGPARPTPDIEHSQSKDTVGNGIEPLSPSSNVSTDRSSSTGRPFLYRAQNSSSDMENASHLKATIFSNGPSLAMKKSHNSFRSNSPGGTIPRALPPRLSLPWLHASVPSGPISSVHGQLSIRIFDNKNMNQTPPLPGPFPPPFGSNINNYGSPSSHGGTGGTPTIESGPSTPVHNFGNGYSPALSKKSSFDCSYSLSVHHSRDGSFEKKDLSSSTTTVEGRSDIPVPSQNMPANANERNSIDIARIEAGLDTRTTVMLKNVPNKMSDTDLRRYINEIVPNSFDFVYLRFDFNSCANVGYAFVNFVDVADLLKFAKARLGVKWNMFCSEKVLQMSYANFQGKEALVEKFKNSCVMEMQDEWVPKIFYSSGPKKGQREPFPPPTNPSRARRSQDQRERGLIRTNNPSVPFSRHLHYNAAQP